MVVTSGDVGYTHGYLCPDKDGEHQIYMRPFGPFPASEEIPAYEGHTHQVDHCLLLLSGAVRVEWTREERAGTLEVEVGADGFPMWFTILADAHHTIYATRDGTKWGCVFLKDQARKVEEEVGHPVAWNM